MTSTHALAAKSFDDKGLQTVIAAMKATAGGVKSDGKVKVQTDR